MTMRVYVDTSVIGGCLDDEFADESRALLDLARQGNLVLLVSDLLLEELAEAPPAVLGVLASLPPEATETLTATEGSRRLRDAYLAAGASSGRAPKTMPTTWPWRRWPGRT